jgi:hypothetical protein
MLDLVKHRFGVLVTIFAAIGRVMAFLAKIYRRLFRGDGLRGAAQMVFG